MPLLAGDGGATHIVNSRVNAQNCRIIGNTAQGGQAGAAFVATDGGCFAGATLTNCTLVSNTASNAPFALRCECALAGDSFGLRVHSSIVWDSGAVPVTQSSSTADVQYSFVQDNFWLSSGVANLNADPAFRFTAPHPYRVRICSPVLDTGSETLRLAISPTSTKTPISPS